MSELKAILKCELAEKIDDDNYKLALYCNDQLIEYYNFNIKDIK